ARRRAQHELRMEGHGGHTARLDRRSARRDVESRRLDAALSHLRASRDGHAARLPRGPATKDPVMAHFPRRSLAVLVAGMVLHAAGVHAQMADEAEKPVHTENIEVLAHVELG